MRDKVIDIEKKLEYLKQASIDVIFPDDELENDIIVLK